MRQILAMTQKEFLLWVKRPGSIIVVFIVPLVFIWIMQIVFGTSGTPMVTVYAVNEDESPASEQVLQALVNAENLRIDILETRSEADRRVGTGERMAAIIVPEGFGSALTSTYGAKIDIIIDPARSEQANIVVGLVNEVLGPFIVEAEVTRGIEANVDQIFGGVIPREVTATELPLEKTITPTFEPPLETPSPIFDVTATEEFFFSDTDDLNESLAPTPELPEQGKTPPDETLRTFFIAAIKGVVSSQVQEAIKNPQVKLDFQQIEEQEMVRRPSLLDFLVPGYSLMFMYFLIPSLAVTVIEERQSGTLRRLLSAPVPRSRILFGKLVPYFVIALIQMTAVIIVSKLIFNIDLGNAPIAIAVVIICSALAMSGLGILIAALAKTETQADGLAIIIVLAMAVISGAMFPNISIPGLQMFTPHYWSMQGFLNVIARGQGIDGILLPGAILLTMATVFFTIGAVRFRFE